MNKKCLILIALLSSFFRLHGCGAELSLHSFNYDESYLLKIEKNSETRGGFEEETYRRAPENVLLITLKNTASESCRLTLYDENKELIVSIGFELRREDTGEGKRLIVLRRIDDDLTEKIGEYSEACFLSSADDEHSSSILELHLSFDGKANEIVKIDEIEHSVLLLEGDE